MATREELYKQFGPVLIEALTLITMDEINLLRVEAGLPPRTKTQLMNAIQAKLDSLDLYDWMTERPPGS